MRIHSPIALKNDILFLMLGGIRLDRYVYDRDYDVVITDVSLVLEGSIKPGTIPWRKTGRHLYCFIYILSGFARYQFRDQIIDVKSGQILFLTKGCIYTIFVGSNDYHYIYVDFDVATQYAPSLKPAVYEIRNQEMTENLFRKMDKQWFYKKPAYHLQCKSILYEIFSRIIQNQTIYIPSTKNEKIRSAVTYMESNFMNKDLSVPMLAGLANMSEAHFRRLFRDIYLMTPIQYLGQLRIDRAKDLLKDGDYSIHRIAELVGYSSIYYFSQAFKNKTGISPSRFASEYQN